MYSTNITAKALTALPIGALDFTNHKAEDWLRRTLRRIRRSNQGLNGGCGTNRRQWAFLTKKKRIKYILLKPALGLLCRLRRLICLLRRFALLPLRHGSLQWSYNYQRRASSTIFWNGLKRKKWKQSMKETGFVYCQFITYHGLLLLRSKNAIYAQSATRMPQ